MIGIYKITNPKGRVYIGQSLNIEKRFSKYKWLDCKGQTRLYASLKKYGVEKHRFEIITECSENELNELERYYQEMYNCISFIGLNCQYVKTDAKKYKHSEETKIKISKSNIGKLGRKYTMSKEHKEKISQSNKGKKCPWSVDYINKVNNKNKPKELTSFYGKKHSNESLLKISEARKNKCVGFNNHKSKIVLDLLVGVFYESISEASKYNNIERVLLNLMLNNKIKNKTNLILA